MALLFCAPLNQAKRSHKFSFDSGDWATGQPQSPAKVNGLVKRW